MNTTSHTNEQYSQQELQKAVFSAIREHIDTNWTNKLTKKNLKASVKPKAKLDTDLGFSSLDKMDLILKLQITLQIDIPENDRYKLLYESNDDLGGLVQYLATRQNTTFMQTKQR